jgi:N-acetylmuramoyl-L-alanine amidase
MKKLVYALICISISVSLVACNNKSTIVNSHETETPSKQEDIKPIEDVKVEAPQSETKPIEEDKANNSSTEKKTEETRANAEVKKPTPVKTSKVIVLDPGHANKSNLQKEPLAPGSQELKIKDGGGAAGVVTRTPEYQINMNVAVKLKKLLEQKGYTVIMTKTENSQSLGNVERAEIWNKTNAALVVRIHADSSENSTAKGASMLIPSPINENTKAIYEKSKSFGQVILSTLISQVGMPNRGVIERKDMTGFNWSKLPVILVEMGFLSNKEEDKKLSTQEYQDKIAKALADGVSSALK